MLEPGIDTATVPSAPRDQVGAILTFIARHGAPRTTDGGGSADYRLTTRGQEISVPIEIHEALYAVLEGMLSGAAVTISAYPELLTIPEVASVLQIGQRQVASLIEDGHLDTHVRQGGPLLIRIGEVLSFRERSRAEAFDELLDHSNEFPDVREEDDVRSDAERYVEFRRRHGFNKSGGPFLDDGDSPGDVP